MLNLTEDDVKRLASVDSVIETLKAAFTRDFAQTLHMPAGSVDSSDENTWLRYAVRRFAGHPGYGVPRSLAAIATSLQAGPHE